MTERAAILRPVNESAHWNANGQHYAIAAVRRRHVNFLAASLADDAFAGAKPLKVFKCVCSHTL